MTMLYILSNGGVSIERVDTLFFYVRIKVMNFITGEKWVKKL
jgi:hypothetical protein